MAIVEKETSMTNIDITEDEPLGTPEAFVRTPDATPQSFDFGAWLAGARPKRRSVRIYQRPDLLARIDQIRIEVDDITDEQDPRVADLSAEYADVVAEIRDSSLVVTLEKRTTEWVRHYRKQVCKRLGVKSNKDGDPVVSDEESDVMVQVNVAQLAEQIIHPPVSADQLMRLREVNEEAVGQLATAMHSLNLDRTPSIVESPDFLRRRSDTTRR